MGVRAEGLLVDHLPRFSQLVQEKAACTQTSTKEGGKAHLIANHLARVERVASEKPPEAPSAGATGFMRDFFGDVSRIKTSIDNGNKIVKGMARMVDAALLATTQEKERAVSACLEKAAEQVRTILAETKASLEQLKVGSEAQEARQPDSSQGKIRVNMQLAMARKHQQLLKDFQSIQIDFKEVLEKRQLREIQLLMPDASQQEVQQMVQDGESASQVIMQRIAGAHASILDEVQRIRDKHCDILKLEQSIAELAQMFREVAVLVDAQGELLDSIETHVHNSKEYTHKAEKELIHTTKLQRSTRKWTCCTMVCLIVVTLAVAAPLITKAF
jgi:syntaxin 1B/2/3